MPTITQLYDEYAIPRPLRTHRLRAAAVGKLVATHWDGPNLDRQSLVRVLLVHEMGLVVDTDATTSDATPQLAADGGQFEMLATGGVVGADHDPYSDSIAIARELGLTESDVDLLSQMAFMRNDETAGGDNWEAKIAAYADQRTAPRGVRSLERRLQRATRQWQTTDAIVVPESRIEQMTEYAHTIEQQLMRHCTIEPVQITGEVVDPRTEELTSVELSRNTRPTL